MSTIQASTHARGHKPTSDFVGDPQTHANDTEPLLPSSSAIPLRYFGQRTGTSKRRFALACISLVLFAMGVLATSAYLSSKQDTRIPTSPLIVAKNGAVAAEAIQCSDAVLRAGGNAVDAAIAAELCIGVINMFSAGIGGFMLIRLPDGTSELIDFRETAPAAANKSMFIGHPELAQTGGLSVGVPHGKLPWHRLFEPAIRLSRNGVRIGAELARRLQSQTFIEADPEWSKVFMPNGTLLKEGDLLKREALADTLEKIANEGPNTFYEGEIAESIVARVQATGGILTLADMRAYRALVREPLIGYYHGRKIITGGAPTSGHALLAMLNILEIYNLKAEGLTPTTVHRWIEAMKYGFAVRSEVGDPDFIDNEKRMAEILTKEFAATVRHNITDDKTHEPAYYNPHFDIVETHGTAHLSTVDKDDMAVALTSTINLLFGSKVLDPNTGVILNDEMDDFSIPGLPNAFGLWPSEYNYIAPGKRPLSSCVPTIVERDSKFEMSIGGAGGSKIVTATLTVILNVFDFNMNILEAIDAVRNHHQLVPNYILSETGWPDDILDSLRQKGHNVGQGIIATLTFYEKDLPISVVNAIIRLPNGTLHAASDYRKHGVAAGY
ncbi:gamma-glutamyltranspeptidase [Endogone sp. FLAS-F59071]|nr:gamma-glutamyltranspeptidase [Endogone sp. FLAS-F59071]|eukprot:RUS19748.1 gamma-glutamyltranspeptidase [Endogone sp. FLAS-F59071]